MTDKIQNGQPFPRLEASVAGREEPMVLPDDLEGEASVVIFYRGHW